MHASTALHPTAAAIEHSPVDPCPLEGPSPTSAVAHDTGLLCLTLIASMHRVAADAAQLAHSLALHNRLADTTDLLRAARLLGLKARAVRKHLPQDLGHLALPAMVRFSDGQWGVIVRRLTKESYLLVHADGRGMSTQSVIAAAAAADRLTGETILVTRREGFLDRATTATTSWMRPTLSRYKRPLASVLLASLCIQIFALVTPLLFQLVIDKVLAHGSTSTLIAIGVAMLAIAAFDCTLQYLRTYVLSHTASRVDVELGARLFDQLTRLPIGYFESRAAGHVVSRIRELEAVRNFITGPALLSVLDLIFSITFVAVLFLLSTRLAVIVLCSIPLYILLGLVLRPILKRRIDERAQRAAANQQYLVETVMGMQTLKSAAVEPTLRSGWEDRLAAYVSASFLTACVGSVGQNAIGFINKATVAAVLFVGANEVIAGNLSIGALIAFNMLLSQIVQPIVRLSQLWQDYQQTQVSMDRLRDILESPIEPKPLAASALPAPAGLIELRDVTFRYRPDLQPALNGLSLTIKPGEVIGIVGASGSGKSTVAKLLQRFYRPEGGQILIDGIDIGHVDPTWVRRNTSVVQQDSVLFNRSVHDNIALASPALSRAQVIECARLAGADEFIAKLPNGYDTIIEERGANLSGGQRQRIAIARALATRPRILILDEATSALDYESENVIRRNMRRIAAGRTVIIIAHRLAAVRDCDRIVALKDGRVVETGTHEGLLRTPDSLYAHYWSMQNSEMGKL